LRAERTSTVILPEYREISDNREEPRGGLIDRR
jgi:hypothetical protein